MADQRYEIKLDLRVNDRELRDAERRISRLGAAGGAGAARETRASATSASRYRHIPDWARPYAGRMADLFSQRAGANRNNFLERVNDTFSRFGRLNRNFLPNLFTPQGLMRNITGLGGAISSLSKAAGAAVPVIGGVLTAFKAFIGLKFAQNMIRGGALIFGTRALNSQALGSAASDIMQMRMAEKGLGGYYPEALRSATDIASQYGFSRVGMLNAINMFSGLRIGERKKLSFEEAKNLAQIAGKISHLGGIAFEKVNTNLQQLFGQTTPSSRDLREMVGQAPFLGKLAMQMMERRGKRGDYREWLKDKKNLLDVLNEFDKLVETSPVLKARGKIALAKQDFWIKLADDLSPYWDVIAEANKKLYAWLGDKIVSWVRNIDTNSLSAMFDSLIKDLNTFVNALHGIASSISWISNNVSNLWLAMGGGRTEEIGGRTYRVFAPVNRYLYYRNAEGDNPYTYYQESGVKGDLMSRYMSPGDVLNEQERIYQNLADNFRLDSLSYVAAAELAKIPADSAANMYGKFKDAFEAERRKFVKPFAIDSVSIGTVYDPTKKEYSEWKIPKYVQGMLDRDAIREWYEQQVNLASLGGGGSNRNTNDELSNISKGARSLIINFNREIVNMPVNIANVNDGADLAQQVSSTLYDVIVRGLNISLNNATGAI